MNYSQEIENSVKTKIIPETDIYDFRGTPLEGTLSPFYIFCRENLNSNSANGTINPNFFLFTNSNEFNAQAKLTKEKHFVITINLGLLRHCFNNYHENSELYEYFQTHYSETTKKFDTPINVLAFQICIQFTYYHELAHLFQFSKSTDDIQIQERNYNEQVPVFSRLNHILEINADTYASISAATHIEQYIRTTFNDDISYKSTFETLLLFCCCLLNYSIGLTEKADKVYFNAHTHPHSFIRLLNIVLNISNHIGNSTYFKKKGITIDSKELFISTVEKYKDIENQKIFKTDFSGIIDNNKESIEKITDYLISIIPFDTKKYCNAMDFW